MLRLPFSISISLLSGARLAVETIPDHSIRRLNRIPAFFFGLFCVKNTFENFCSDRATKKVDEKNFPIFEEMEKLIYFSLRA